MNGLVELDVEASMAVKADFTGRMGGTLRRGKDISGAEGSGRTELGICFGIESCTRDSEDCVDGLIMVNDPIVLDEW